MNEVDRITAAIVFAEGEMKTDAQRAAIRKMVQSMLKDCMDSDEIVKALCCAVLDGLRYGNWPTA